MTLWFQNLADWLERNSYDLTCDIKIADAPWENVQWLFEEPVQPNTIYIDIPTEFYNSVNYISIVDIHGNLIRIKNGDAQEIFNTIIDMMEHFSQWYRKLLACVLKKKTLEEMLCIAADYFKSPMILGAEDGHIFSYTAAYLHLIPEKQKSYFTNEALSYMMHHAPQYQMSRNRMFGKHQPYFETSLCFTKVGTDQYVRKLVANLFWKQERCGFLNIYEYNQPFYPGDLYIIRLLRDVIVQRMSLEPEKYLSADYLEFILHRLCSGQNVEQTQLDYVFQYSSWKQGDLFTLICADKKYGSDSITSQQLLKFLQNLKKEFGACRSIVVDRQIAILVDRSQMMNLEPLFKYLRSAPVLLCFGVSNEYRDILKTGFYWKQAREVQKDASAIGATVLRVSQIITRRLQAVVNDSPLLSSYYHPIFKMLHLSDWKENTELEHTLKVFILCGCNYTDTANALNIHRNTVMKRIDRIKELTDYDESSPAQYEALLLSALMIPEFPENRGDHS